MLEPVEGGGRRRSQGFGGHFTLEANSCGTAGRPARPLRSSSPDNTSPIIPSPPAFMDEPQTLCHLHCVGQTGNGEQQFNQGDLLVQCASLGPAGQLKTAAEVADGLSCLFFHIAPR